MTALVSGCGSPGTPVGPATPVATAETAAAGASAGASAGATSAATATPIAVGERSSPSATPHSTDLAACRDGDCEVEVRRDDRLKVDPKFGVDSVTVVSLGDGYIRLALEGHTGGLHVQGGGNVSVSGSCVNGRCHDEAEMSLTPDMPVRVDGLRLVLVSSDSSRAVLRFRRD
ncbi:hypothetical protein [Microbispora sp. NPDC049125]|uniref:hypothetical protein n=1 Tax=Microbispora sp. NPDC049125 TaxID=3154929 RepID=UPI0034669A13